MFKRPAASFYCYETVFQTQGAKQLKVRHLIEGLKKNIETLS